MLLSQAQVTKSKTFSLICHGVLCIKFIALIGSARSLGFIDLKKFLAADNIITGQMRSLTFSFVERLVLVPVEISLVFKLSLLLILGFFVVSGVNSNIFSINKNVP